MYLDDIITFTKHHDDQLQNIGNVLWALPVSGAPLKLRKCHRLASKVEYHDPTITPHKRIITKAHNNGLKVIQLPRSLTEPHSFLDMYNVYPPFCGQLLSHSGCNEMSTQRKSVTNPVFIKKKPGHRNIIASGSHSLPHYLNPPPSTTKPTLHSWHWRLWTSAWGCALPSSAWRRT